MYGVKWKSEKPSPVSALAFELQLYCDTITCVVCAAHLLNQLYHRHICMESPLYLELFRYLHICRFSLMFLFFRFIFVSIIVCKLRCLLYTFNLLSQCSQSRICNAIQFACVLGVKIFLCPQCAVGKCFWKSFTYKRRSFQNPNYIKLLGLR